MDIEKIRNLPVEELGKDEKQYLANHLWTQVQEEDLTPKDKKFLSTPIQYECTYCGKTYRIAPAVCNGQCQRCMAEQGLKYEKNPLTPVSNAASALIYWIIGAAIVILIMWGWS